MPDLPNMPNIPEDGWRKERAAELQAEAEKAGSAPTYQDPDACLERGAWHTVEENETLDTIADRYQCPVEAIGNHPANTAIREDEADDDSLSRGEEIYIPAEDDEEAGPVGQGEHIVRQGECISSIAVATGHFWARIWNDPANNELRIARGDPNVLLPGDRVKLPEKRRKEVPRESEQRHRFLRRGEPTMLRLRVLKDDTVFYASSSLWEPEAEGTRPVEIQQELARSAPRANEPYTIEIDGEMREGITSANGEIAIPIGGEDRRAHLIVGTEPNTAEYDLRLGRLDPVETTKGVQQRLHNTGYACGPIDGIIGKQTRGALHHFQRDHDLPKTRRADKATRESLVERHGS